MYHQEHHHEHPPEDHAPSHDLAPNQSPDQNLAHVHRLNRNRDLVRALNRIHLQHLVVNRAPNQVVLSQEPPPNLDHDQYQNLARYLLPNHDPDLGQVQNLDQCQDLDRDQDRSQDQNRDRDRNRDQPVAVEAILVVRPAKAAPKVNKLYIIILFCFFYKKYLYHLSFGIPIISQNNIVKTVKTILYFIYAKSQE